MVLNILRALFVLLMAAAGWYFIQQADPILLPPWMRDYTWLAVGVTLSLGVLLVSIDILAPRKKLVIFSGTFLGLLVGLMIAYALSFIVQLLVVQFAGEGSDADQRNRLIEFIDLLIGVISCYLSISFILQTKDDFRFIIPYVEFSKQTKGARPILLDTSVLIDGRITDIVATGIIESQLVVPQFVIDELQLIADSGDKLKRNRGRRGLDVLQKLRTTPHADVAMYDASVREARDITEVDQKLVHLAQEMSARVLTNDFNLHKVAEVRGVDVINLNDLAVALKPVALPGEKMRVRLIKPGDESGQGVGYLEDGTMVVIEQGRVHVNEDVDFIVTNATQSKQGKMIFGRLADLPAPPPPTPPGAGTATRRPIPKSESTRT